jgi:hypothetical protein
VKLSTKDLSIELARIWVFKRKESTYHSIENDSAAPYINFATIVGLACNHLRGSVAGRPACCLERATWLVGVTKPKVNQLNIPFVVNQKVLRLEVSVYYIELVQVFNP